MSPDILLALFPPALGLSFWYLSMRKRDKANTRRERAERERMIAYYEQQSGPHLRVVR